MKNHVYSTIQLLPEEDASKKTFYVTTCKLAPLTI